MNFLPRLGWSLLLFGAVALVASFFGYAPRKLAHLPPEQVKIAAVSLMAAGGVALLLGGDPRIRRKVLLGLAAAAGLAVLSLVALLAIGYFAHKRHMRPLPPPSPPPSWSPPPSVPSATGGAPTQRAGVSPMSVLFEKRRAWETQYGRERVWSVVVHLGTGEPPQDFEASLGKLTSAAGGGVATARTGRMVQACLAPLEDSERLSGVLAELFPGARVQVSTGLRQVTVFVRPS